MPLTRLKINDELVTFEEALELARAGETDLPFPFIKAVISGIVDRQSKVPADQISVTDIVSCHRQKYIMATEDYAEDPADLMFAFRGQLMHQLLAKYAQEEALVETRTSREYQGHMLYGTSDSIITARNNGRYQLTDFKSTKKIPLYSPWKNHVCQVNLYAWLYELPYGDVDMSVIYFDLNGGEVAEKKLTKKNIWSEEEAEAYLDEKFIPLAKALETKTMPKYRDVPTEITSWACKYCPVYSNCFNHLLEEVGALPIYAKNVGGGKTK